VTTPPVDAYRRLQQRTARHYDAHPFDFLTPADETAIRDLQPPPFRRFVDHRVPAGARTAEIGCGPGRGTLFLARAQVDVIAVDISRQSLLLARQRAPGGPFVQASNLALPFRDDAFDVVVSDGVAHHTPNARASFAEYARVTRPGGFCYLGVYNRHRPYYYVYTFCGPFVRWMERRLVGRMMLFATLVPLYWLGHRLRSRGVRTWRGAVNFFYDYIMTPRATFHTFEEIRGWSDQEGFELVEYDPSLGNVHVFILRKRNPATLRGPDDTVARSQCP
jgi:SAM-dependent methyltransferase